MITEKIRLRRIKKNYSQEYMGLQLGISQKAYSKIEAGTTELTVSRLTQIAAILGLCMVELVLAYPAPSPVQLSQQ